MATEDGIPTGAGAGSYTQYKQDHEYHYDSGRIVLPVAGLTTDTPPRPKHRVIVLHGGLGLRTVRFNAQRRNKPPLIPNMDDLPYDTFLSGTVVPTLPMPDPNGIGYFWNVSGEYTYVQRWPRVAGDNTFPTGQYPFPIAPNDAVASGIASDSGAVFATSDPDTTNPYDVVAQALGSTVDHDTERYLWPFTVLPPQFTSPDLLGA